MNPCLAHQLRRAEAGEIGHRWFEDCRVVLEHFSRFTGTERLVADLMADDFLKYRRKLVRAGISGRKGLGTYIPTDEGWLYLAGVIDLYSRKIVGWSMADRLETDLVADALMMALSVGVRPRAPETTEMVRHDAGGQPVTADGGWT